MGTTKFIRFIVSAWRPSIYRIISGVVVFLATLIVYAGSTRAEDLKVMKMGLGSGMITSNPAGINCGGDCDGTYGSGVSVILTAIPDPGSTFSGWEGDGSGTTARTVIMSADSSVRAVFNLSPAIPTLTDFTPAGIQSYLIANPNVTTAARFVNALPSEFKQNWILMSRSESLQTGTAEFPRLLLPSANAHFVFTVGMATHNSYPGSHPNAVEFMQWDPAEKNFRFHEIVLDEIPAMDIDGDGIGVIPLRPRGVSIDDSKCSKCHSTRNVLNRSSFPGTTGIPPGVVKAKYKPNWDSYDSWGGMMPFNRDRIYQGSVEAAAFRKVFNPWTWRTNASVRSIIAQLELQPPGVPAAHVITRTNGGANDGHINFAFDSSPPVLTEPAPSSSGAGIEAPIATSYSFDGAAGTGAATSATRGGSFVTLHHSNIPTSDEGRGVRLFDALGGLGSPYPNQQRIADELINHRFATGSVPIDIRPICLAIAKSGRLSINATTNTVESTVAGAPLTIDLGFFDARNGMRINELVADTRMRAFSIPRRKADLQRSNLDRAVFDGPDADTDPDLDPYLSAAANGLIQQYGTITSPGTDTSLSRIRQEVFRRPIDLGFPDRTEVLGEFVGGVYQGIYVDRELETNIGKVALFRYFLEPLGVSVDKWSMGVRGRSRTYTFADVFGTYLNEFEDELRASLLADPVAGLSDPNNDAQLIAGVNGTLASLPSYDAVPTYTDVQRIFNKSCIECHGGLDYPPYSSYGGFLDLSEDEDPPAGDDRLYRSFDRAVAFANTDPATSLLYQRITDTGEDCPYGVMPCGGPPLSKADIETIRRWILGPPSRPYTHGDPHIKTIDGVNYDFQAAGEYVLLRGQNLEIQARQTAVETDSPLGPNAHTGLTSCVSVNSAVAVRIGRHRVTYQPNLSGDPDPDGLQLRVDGKLVQMSGQITSLASGGRIIQTTAPGGIQIEAPGGTVIVITPGWWNYYQLWYLNIDVRHVRATQGVMGVIAPGNWLPALPDGRFTGPRPGSLQQRYKDLYGVFGNSWQVSDTTTLFDYAPGTSTETFTIESWPNGESPQSCTLPPGQGPGKPPVKALALEVARKLCRDIVNDDRRADCEKDVMVTGERGFAKTYLLADQIERNAVPTAPVLVYPENFKTELVTPVTFTWNKATDLDGDPITYRHYVWPVDERPDNSGAEPVSIGVGISDALLVVLLVVLLLALLIFLSTKKKPGFMVLVAAAILATIILGYYLGGGGPVSKTISELKSGKAYFWKVIAEDGKGGTVESETRRFEIK